LTEGRISAIENSDSGTQILPHTAQIAPGNSGGPLVDQCGRVLGIDTFITASSADVVHSNYALSASVLGDFLNANQTPVTLQTAACDDEATSAQNSAPPVSPAPAAAPGTDRTPPPT
jgi:S1-C subfamily serine protease